MECPFELPAHKPENADYLGNYFVLDAKRRVIARDLTSYEADYLVTAISSYEKLYNLLQGAYGYIPEGDCMQEAIERELKKAEKEYARCT